MTEHSTPHLPETGVVMVSKTGCPYCDKASTMLDRMGQDFTKIVIDDTVARNGFYDQQGLEGNKRTVPQVFINGERIGGYMELVARATKGPLLG